MNVRTFRSLLSSGWHSSHFCDHPLLSLRCPPGFPVSFLWLWGGATCLGAETKGSHVQSTPKASNASCTPPHAPLHPPYLSFSLTGWSHIFFSLFWFAACCITGLCLVCVFLASFQTWPAPYPLYIKAIPQTDPQPSLIFWPQPCFVLGHLWFLSVFQ